MSKIKNNIREADKIKNRGTVGRISIKRSVNNVIITVADTSGNGLGQFSGGSVEDSSRPGKKFKNSAKGTPHAANIAADAAANKARDLGFQSCEVHISGNVLSFDNMLRTINSKIPILALHSKSAIPHGGTRPPKERRV